MSFFRNILNDKKSEVVLFSSTAIALYGYDQGMMSLVNTNYDYLQTMGIEMKSPLVGIIVSVYYLGCAVGAILASLVADKAGRKPSIFACLAVTAVGNLLMFVAGIGNRGTGLVIMFVGRIIMGLGVGGIDAVIPVYSSELNSDGGRGEALAKEFQSNIFGLNMAFAINLVATATLGKRNQWAWRIPIIAMQIYPLLLLSFIYRLPEAPRWCIFNDKHDQAKQALMDIYGKQDMGKKYDELVEAHEQESSHTIGYRDMISPWGEQFHQSCVTIMGQVNQALTGYGAISVYNPQIFQLLGLGVTMSEYLTQANYVSYFILMTLAWLLIDRLGRRLTMVAGGLSMGACFLILGFLGAMAKNADNWHLELEPITILGGIILFLATGAFGIGWLSQAWLIPTEIYPSSSRAQGSAISVIVWGLANFAVTLLTPILFNNLSFWIFFIFTATNLFATVWTWVYCPETGGRSFQENQEFFKHAEEQSSWSVLAVDHGDYRRLPKSNDKSSDEAGERQPLLSS